MIASMRHGLALGAVLIAAFAFASTLNRRTGIVVAILAGIIAAIVPGRISLANFHAWDSLFRLCFLSLVLGDQHRELGNRGLLKEPA